MFARLNRAYGQEPQFAGGFCWRNGLRIFCFAGKFRGTRYQIYNKILINLNDGSLLEECGHHV